MYDVAIIGCGITGAAAAYALSRYEVNTVILEAENDVAAGTTKANSAIVHAGYDPKPGTLMARLNVAGNQLTRTICQALDVPFQPIGSLVLALEESEVATLQTLYDRGIANGVPGLQLLSREETLALEPNVNPAVCGALFAPSAAIVSPWELALAMAEIAVVNGTELRRSAKVTAITPLEGGGYALTTPNGIVEARYVINAAGIYADAVHNMAAEPAFHITPTRGEYYLLDHSEQGVVSHVIFQCPNQYGKGILVAPTVHGNVIVGPTSEPVEGENIANTTGALQFIDRQAHRSIPSLNLRASIRNFAGVRASADIDDFIIQESAPGFVDLAGIKSPGLTAAPAIGEEAVQILAQSGLALSERKNWINTRSKVRFKELSPAEKQQLVSEHPAYGRVICRCETITEGEILDAIHSPIPPVSIDGVKRRCNAGMGRCQGGFCGPRVLELLSREEEISPLDVLQDKAGTQILIGETKQGGIVHV
jgi:glycerol-3-phosphate dehydrogenase